MASLASLKTEERLLDRQAANSIRQQIVTGMMPPNHRLLETTLSRELEVSRGTIRSALMQLANEGLVQQIAFTKWEVASASATEAWELYTLRSAHEGLAASLAAKYASVKERKKLQSIYQKIAAAVAKGNREAATDADFELHRMIVSMSQHNRLIREYERLILQVRFQMFHIGFAPRDYNDLIDDHKALTEAVVSGDAALAEQLARTHNRAEIARLLADGAGKNKPE